MNKELFDELTELGLLEVFREPRTNVATRAILAITTLEEELKNEQIKTKELEGKLIRQSVRQYQGGTDVNAT